MPTCAPQGELCALQCLDRVHEATDINGKGVGMPAPRLLFQLGLLVTYQSQLNQDYRHHTLLETSHLLHKVYRRKKKQLSFH